MRGDFFALVVVFRDGLLRVSYAHRFYIWELGLLPSQR